ncbi:hypothetical protein AC578_5670 [Pseudocercospora eumusae]|uniref:Uncharacterized protein n=1 Tax=Pseudocercospora eumusae TaxID=321146 RepID=A0A139H391_9PEZI|nr:hypothetical protein AC578_5670 [Pseudocercospora eumusae]
MSSLSASSLESGAGGVQPSPYQERLTNFCRSQGIGPANFQLVSDKREDAAEGALQVLGVMPTPPSLASAAQQQHLGGRYFSVQEVSQRGNRDDKSVGGRTPGRGQTVTIPRCEHPSMWNINANSQGRDISYPGSQYQCDTCLKRDKANLDRPRQLLRAALAVAVLLAPTSSTRPPSRRKAQKANRSCFRCTRAIPTAESTGNFTPKSLSDKTLSSSIKGGTESAISIVMPSILRYAA